MEEPKPYQFGRAAAHGQSAGIVNAIDKLGDRLARRLRLAVEPYSGGRPTVTPKPVDRTMFMMWDACVPPFVSLSLYRAHPVKGPVALRIDAGLISALVDRFYGGKGGTVPAEMREFSPTEDRIVERLAGQFMKVLAECWAEITPLECFLLGRETGLAHAEIAEADAEMLVHGFAVNIGERDPFTIEFVYPMAGLEGIETGSTSTDIDMLPRVDPIWQRQLAGRLNDVRLPARTVLARPNLKMSELMALKPGDVINIHIARHLPLIVGDRVFAHGTIGEQDGRAAFMIEKLA